MSRLFRFKMGPDPQTAINHEVENDLASSVESPDALTWTIKLRPDAKFQNIAPVNGHAVEAEDVKATFVRALSLPANPSRGALGFIDPNQIQMPASDTLVFKLKFPYGPFLNTIAAPTYGRILPREAQTDAYDPAKQLIGSGPFILDSYQPDVQLVFKKNPDYYEKELPSVDAVRLAIVPSEAQNVAQFTAGSLSATRVSQTDSDQAKKSNPRAVTITEPATSSQLLYFQLGDPSSPFLDVRLRRAISMALDRGTMSKVLYDGHASPAFYVPASMGKWALTMDELDASVQQYYKFDLAQAKTLFAQAGGSSLNVRLAYYTNGPGPDPNQNARPSQMVYSMLQALPWQINLGTFDYAKDFVGGGKGIQYGNIPLGWIIFGAISPFSETDQWLFGYYDSQSTSNEERVKDPALDSMIEKARTIVDADARRAAYLDVQKYLASNVFTVAGLPVDHYTTLVQPSVANFQYTPETGNYGDMWARLWLTG